MVRKETLNKILSIVLAFSVCLSVVQPVLANETKTVEENNLFYVEDYTSYQEYLAQYPLGEDATSEIVVNCTSPTIEREQVTIDDVRSIILPQDEKVEYVFQVEQSAFYNLEIMYYPMEASDTSIKLDMKLDGEHPYEETSSLNLPRIWGFKEETRKDSQNNEIRPDSVELQEWIHIRLENISGAGGEALKFYLEEGEHCLSIEALQNPVALSEIRFTQPQQVLSYDDVLAQWEKAGYADAEESLKLQQAELTSGRSEKSISMINDRSSATTTPYHSYQIRYNAIGGSSWKMAGDWIEWKIQVPKSGLYTISTRFLQNEKMDDISTRVLTIDGELPFAEAASLSFPYSSSWQTMALGDEESVYKFYLEEGEHVLRMTAAMGESAHIINRASEILDELNNIYIDIVMVTGTDPDTNRDYGIKKLLPDVLEKMESLSNDLKELNEYQNQVTGLSTGNATFERLYEQLDRMVKEPEKVPHRLKNFLTNITSLGTWINGNRGQALTLDYIQLLAPDEKVPNPEKGIFATLKHHILQFFGSFRVDYAAVGSTELESDRKIKVWIGTGRDQADIIRKMINSQFTPQSGIEVELQLVNAGALLPATLAKIGPDVCLSVTETEPVNYALRDAVVDLSELEGAEEVFSRFHEASLTAFRLDDGVYALPETMEYPMLFYRKDILSELGIKAEDLESWDSVLQTVLPELKLSGFDFGFTTDLKNYASLLYQQGGAFYNESKTASLLSEPEAYTAFHMMTRLYTDYEIPKAFDFANRFRSGQMPLAVSSYTSYNQLSVFAPEIEGLWGMTTLPGIMDEEGNVNNAAAVTVTGAIIMKDSENIDDAWTFLKWWTQEEVQSEYANELETIMGTAARYATANLAAMESIQWDFDIKEALVAQREQLVGMEQLAGSYYTSRYFEFAFRDVVNNGENDRESLLEANENITNEILEKRLEFYGEEK